MSRRSRSGEDDRHLEWMRDLARDVWQAERLPSAALPPIRLGRPARSTRGYFSYAAGKERILVRADADLHTMRNTLLHELAHAVHWWHSSARDLCSCKPRCTKDGHGPMFKRHLTRIEHRHQPGTHSRWGLAGCLNRRRVPAGTPWHSKIECPRRSSAG